MKEKKIAGLIEKFFNGETSLSEERRLYAYFNRGDIPVDLQCYRPIFSGFASLPDPQPMRKKLHFIRWSAGIAASLVLLCGSFWAWNAYEDHMLQARYGGSYMIVNGKRIDNLKKIQSSIESSLADAHDIEQLASDQPSVLLIEQELMDNISDPEELERIKELLN